MKMSSPRAPDKYHCRITPRLPAPLPAPRDNKASTQTKSQTRSRPPASLQISTCSQLPPEESTTTQSRPAPRKTPKSPSATLQIFRQESKPGSRQPRDPRDKPAGSPPHTYIKTE